jgi:hypothetical protein
MGLQSPALYPEMVDALRSHVAEAETGCARMGLSATAR